MPEGQFARFRRAMRARRSNLPPPGAPSPELAEETSLAAEPAELASSHLGVVEEFGARRIVGWIACAEGAPPTRVSLLLDDLEVTSTWVSGDGKVRPFTFAVSDIWKFVTKRSRLSVRVAGQPIPIRNHGAFLRPSRKGERHATNLHELLAAGHVFSHNGRLQLSKKLDVEWQHRVTALYNDVRAAVRESFGYECFAIYGTLLGAVREGGFIGHDMDFDFAYLSDQTDPSKAAQEVQRVALTLIDRGFDVETRLTALHIHHPDDENLRVDLFHIYFDDAGELCFPFGVAGTSRFPRSAWRGLKEIELADASVAIPAAAEQLVEHIYGAGWRDPNPGFDWTRDRTQFAGKGRLPQALREGAYWSNFYAHHSYPTGSTFFEYLNARSDTPSVVIDLGCGDGRDSLAFAAAGRRAFGIDLSEVGVRAASREAERRDLSDLARFSTCDVSDAEALSTALRTALDATPTEPAMFYLRFFLHSIPKPTQNTVMGTIARHARTGDYFAAEFRTDKDAEINKVHGRHYRRFQNGPEFGIQLRRYGFTVLDEQEGSGLSPYQGEDPELYRVIARRNDVTSSEHRN